MYMYIYMHFQVCFGFSKHTVQKWSLLAVFSVREYNMSLTVLSGLREKQITKSSSCSEASNHNCVNAHVHVHSCTQKIGYKFRRNLLKIEKLTSNYKAPLQSCAPLLLCRYAVPLLQSHST